ncbi:hypothetical protein BCR44DRAFT_1447463 [Catenaria anguillulae PL171]|uniref:Uncharacterized protein n=1 Tax=Catenaria anguillulae PL171 TaxID=765915 RepID=A0A1Y2H5N4_9FUNG|nr:hypothetical protein BCR44DRAFT_1447463 [Catenaria anguillulae PL171]
MRLGGWKNKATREKKKTCNNMYIGIASGGCDWRMGGVQEQLNLQNGAWIGNKAREA